MTSDEATVRAMRRILESSASGRGVSRSAIEELRGGDGLERDAARSLLLGESVGRAMEGIVEGASEEVSMMASLVPEMAKSSPDSVGRGVGGFSETLERWVRAGESRRMEWKVQEFRGLLSCAVLGAVVAVVSSLGPIVGNLSFGSASAQVDGSGLRIAAVVMAGNGAVMLGLYLSGKRLVLNVIACLLAFSFVSFLVSPLVSLQPTGFLAG